LLVSEFWGTLLNPKGEILMPNCTYTTCAGRVIQEPEVSPYKTLRWPGMAFSPLPNLLRFDGRGLLQGVKTLWHFMCGLLCLHADNLNWNVNPPVEINVQALVQAADTEWFPGKQYHVKDTISGQQAIRTVDRKGITGDVLANLNFAAQNFDKGSLVHEVTQGLPGYRGEAPTARGKPKTSTEHDGVRLDWQKSRRWGALHHRGRGRDYRRQYFLCGACLHSRGKTGGHV
jgi:hypothetical protein